MKELELKWEVDISGKKYFNFYDNEVSKIDDEINGIYIIWLPEHNPRSVIKVGQGNIKNRLQNHLRDDAIAKYKLNSKMVFSWAKVNLNQCGGVENYLGDFLEPREGERYFDDSPIKVNLPF